MKQTALILVSLVLMVILFGDQSKAIPAFARKYATSCQTCHNGFPKLNAFGEAFRRNGYQFPAGADPEMIKQEQVSLGSEGNKKEFPDAIWPGSLPGSSPISLFLNTEADYNPHGSGPRFTFGPLESGVNSIEAVAAGTFGEDLSFWGHVILNDDHTIELNRMFLIFSNLIGSSYQFNARVGIFEPGVFSFSTHRAWMEGYWITTQTLPGNTDMAWSLEETQKGIEVNGICNGRFGYNAGIVEGFGSPHSDKDYYGHITYKINGLPLDGVVDSGATINGQKPWIDNSLTLGAFTYIGNALLGPDSMLQENKFSYAGGDFNAYYDRFNLFGGVGIRHDDQPYVGAIGTSINSTVWFTELDVLIFPWLLPGVRYESWNGNMLDGSSTVSFTDAQFVPGIVFLIRPNVKTIVRTSISKLESNHDTEFSLNQVQFLLAVGL